jgi:hypothetical protein
VAAIGWAVALVLAGYLSARNDPPTVREQRSIAQAAPVVDRAAGELVAAAGPDAVLEVSDRRLTSGCRLTAARPGATLERSVSIRTAAADGPAMVDRLAGRLPAGHQARARHSGAIHQLRADAGEFVGISGGVTAPGVVTLTVSSGCRPPSPGFAVRVEPPSGRPVDQVPVRILAGLGASAVKPLAGTSVPCPGGGISETARATGRAAAGTDKRDAYGYRDAGTAVIVRREGTTITVAATTLC